VIGKFEWNSGGNVNAPSFLSGLSVGATYQVQFFSGRSFPGVGNRSLAFGDGNGNFSPPISMAANSFVSVVGTFVADAATQHVTFNDSANLPVVSAYVLREVAPIPEPGTWVMLAAGLALLGAVAKRRTTV